MPRDTGNRAIGKLLFADSLESRLIRKLSSSSKEERWSYSATTEGGRTAGEGGSRVRALAKFERFFLSPKSRIGSS